jgi:hypothetical protein
MSEALMQGSSPLKPGATISYGPEEERWFEIQSQ